MVPGGSIAYPGTLVNVEKKVADADLYEAIFLVDRYLYAIQLSCLKSYVLPSFQYDYRPCSYTSC